MGNFCVCPTVKSVIYIGKLLVFKLISSISVSDYVRITLILSQYLLLSKKSFKFPKKNGMYKLLCFHKLSYF